MGSILKSSTLPRPRTRMKAYTPYKQYVSTATPAVERKFIKRAEESEVIQACNWLRKTYPHVIFFSDPIAMKMSDTMRINVMKMRSGDGIPDVHIMFPSRGFHGLVIEFKATDKSPFKKDGTLKKAKYTRKFKKNGKIWIKTGDHNAEQYAMLQRYNDMGYCGRYAIGLEAFKKLVDWYMENEQQSLF